MANTCHWKGAEVPEKVGTVKLHQCVTLQPKQEHLVWGKLPRNAPMSPGSTVVVEPTTSKSVLCDIMVSRVVTPLWGDRWVSVKVTNSLTSQLLSREIAHWQMYSRVLLLKSSNSSKVCRECRVGWKGESAFTRFIVRFQVEDGKSRFLRSWYSVLFCPSDNRRKASAVTSGVQWCFL